MNLVLMDVPCDQVSVLVLADIAPVHRLWGWSRIVKGPLKLRSLNQLRFSKVLGSGFDGGFGLRPSASRQGLFAVFSSLGAAEEFIADSDVMHGYREHASECCVLKLRVWSCRGSWDGQTLAPSISPPDGGPVAALTRASIALRKAPAFWRHAPASQTALETAPGCQLAVGLGEAPFLRQATFTLWDSLAAMDAYARSGPHLEAIKAAAKEEYFTESMFARFVTLSVQGTWKGHHYG
jgi:heme-degrading monooxygenase HmoA